MLSIIVEYLKLCTLSFKHKWINKTLKITGVLGIIIWVVVISNFVFGDLVRKKFYIAYNTEGEIISEFVKQCNNGKSNQCYTSRWWINNNFNSQKKIEADIYQVWTCENIINRKGWEEKKCSNIIGQSKYHKNLVIPRYFYYEAKQNRNGCASYSIDELKAKKIYSFLKYINTLNVNISSVTSCIDKERLTLLLQREGHIAKSQGDDIFTGCNDGSCLPELTDLHYELKKN